MASITSFVCVVPDPCVMQLCALCDTILSNAFFDLDIAIENIHLVM